MKNDSQDQRCDATRDALLLAADGIALADEAVRHLAECEACREFKALVDAGVASTRALATPPAELDAMILAYARQRTGKASRELRFPLFMRFAAAAALVAVFSVGAWLAVRLADETIDDDGFARASGVQSEVWHVDDMVEELIAATLWLEVAGLGDEWGADSEMVAFSAEIKAELYALQAEFYLAAVADE